MISRAVCSPPDAAGGIWRKGELRSPISVGETRKVLTTVWGITCARVPTLQHVVPLAALRSRLWSGASDRGGRGVPPGRGVPRVCGSCHQRQPAHCSVCAFLVNSPCLCFVFQLQGLNDNVILTLESLLEGDLKEMKGVSVENLIFTVTWKDGLLGCVFSPKIIVVLVLERHSEHFYHEKCDWKMMVGKGVPLHVMVLAEGEGRREPQRVRAESALGLGPPDTPITQNLVCTK